MPPCSTIEITCNQINFLRNHDGIENGDELLGKVFLFGMDVADMTRALQSIAVRSLVIDEMRHVKKHFTRPIPVFYNTHATHKAVTNEC